MVAYHSTCEQCIPDAKAYNNGGTYSLYPNISNPFDFPERQHSNK